jgi:hypothetical protein
MNHARLITGTALAALCVAVLPSDRLGAKQGTPAASADAHIAALKQNLAESQKRIRQFEWVETTIISLKGEEKARRQQRAYYGSDGKLQKLPIGNEPQQQKPQAGGRRGGRLKQNIIENKKEEMQDYMERAAGLIHMYVPPSPERVQSAKDAGRMAVRSGAQGRVTLEFSDYLLAGDRLNVAIDASANRLIGLDVATYLEKPEDKVTLNVRMGSLIDGTGFTEQTTLEATAQNIRVVIQNSGHRPMAR